MNRSLREPNEELELPGNLAGKLEEFRKIGQLIDTAVDSYRRGDKILEDIDRRKHLGLIKIPAPWCIALIQNSTELQIETQRRPRPLDPKVWVPLEGREAITPHIKWTRAYPRRPVFIGNSVEIDYLSPEMTRWIYSKDKRVRAACCKGIDFLLRTTTQVEKMYTP